MQMRLTQPFVLILLAIARIADASKVVQPRSAPTGIQNPYLGLSNATRSVGVPDLPDSLDVSIEIGGPRLHQTACLMNTIAALRQLALGEYDAKIIDGTEYKLNSYPQVSILVNTPKRKRNVQAKYVISAITLGILEMVEQKKFQLAQFEITLDVQLIGWVHVVNNPSTTGFIIGGSHSNGTVETAKRSATQPPSSSLNPYDVNITNSITTDLTVDPDEARLTTTFTPTGDKVDIYDVFIPIMNSLSDMASFPGTRYTGGLVATFEGRKAMVCILQVRPERKTPPLLEYRWLIRTLSRIPAFMVEGHRFGEMDIAIEVDGVDIATGRLTNVPGCGDLIPTLAKSSAASQA